MPVTNFASLTEEQKTLWAGEVWSANQKLAFKRLLHKTIELKAESFIYAHTTKVRSPR